jgi:aryl-alcohol dehydrogenase-like predicted oxidoreductase
MERRVLGGTGLSVSPICVGAAPLGDMPETFDYSVGEERARETLRAIIDSEINFLDTAASYGDGESERRIGNVLREMGGLPEGFVLATKADRDLSTGEFTGEQMRRSVERSLRLLGLDSLRLVYLHDPEHESFERIMAEGGPAEVLLRLKEEGVIGHLGIAGGPIGLITRFVETGIFEAAITHNRYTLLDRSAEPLLDVCAERGVALLNAAPLRQRHPRKRPRRLRPLRVPGGPREDGREGAPDAAGGRGVRCAPGRRGPAALPPRPAHRLDRGGHQPPREGTTDPGAGGAGDTGGPVGRAGGPRGTTRREPGRRRDREIDERREV